MIAPPYRFSLLFFWFVKYSKNMEIGIYNCCIQNATTRNVVKKWSNPYFIVLYTDLFRSVFKNLDGSIIEKLNQLGWKYH